MITTIITREYNELCNLVSDMTYEQAFKTLNGYNLTADPITMGKEKKLIGINEFFEVTYKHISTTIFRTEDNGCEVWEEFDAHMSIGDNGAELF